MIKNILPIKIKNQKPTDLPISDIVILFNHFERSILKLTEGDIKININLVGVQNSTGTTFQTTSLQFEEYKKAYIRFTSHIKSLLKKKQIPTLIWGHLKEMLNLSRKRNLQIEFEDENFKPLAELTPETPMPMTYLKGYTEIWGIIEKVGGKEPHIVVRLLNDRTISIKVKPEEAKKAANYLYEKIYIKGLGKWSPEGELISFIPEKIKYFHKPTKERMEEIRKKLSISWKNVDVESFLRELRAE